MNKTDIVLDAGTTWSKIIERDSSDFQGDGRDQRLGR